MANQEDRPTEKAPPSSQQKKGRGKIPPLSPKSGVWTWVLLGVGVLLLLSVIARPELNARPLSYSEFKARIEAGEIKRVVLSDNIIKGYTETAPAVAPTPSASSAFRAPSPVYSTIRVEDPKFTELLDGKKVQYEAEDPSLKNFFLHWVLPFLLLLMLWRVLFSRAFRMGPGAGIMSFGKNRARLVVDDSKKVTFSDVAGVEEAKEELLEIIEFLKTPQKFRAIGGKIPKGILLVGPPGTGKTLLARAVAGEAGVPFFSLSGSEFVEMFVGVGAARVRDLFAQAVDKSPCIIFIDELDAIGKVRSAVSPMGGHDEREQTLNQLLVEMDGFDTRTGVIIMAATNRPETLDPALLRAGRFDRQVLVDRPDINGREAILRIHGKNVKVDPKVDWRTVAARTPGFVGADLANVVNEAALLAVRKGKQQVELSEFDDAIDRVIAGLQKKTRLINEKEKRIVAHHEMGHALVTVYTPGTDPVHKISVIPRGFGALGFTMNLPKEDRYLMTKQELLARIDILYGGRVAEEVVFNEISTGASDDLQKATDIAKRMVMEYGMSDNCGPRTFATERPSFLQGGGMGYNKEFSEATAEQIDREVKAILDTAYVRVRNIVIARKDMLVRFAAILSEKEVIEGKDLELMIETYDRTGGRLVFPETTEAAPVVEATVAPVDALPVIPESDAGKGAPLEQ
ncbi:ATP-dependent zinc metalloprotease FtsH [bacterium]|nr:ATP-dependent zinc metalloprotease FtsH [bacterium]